MGIFYVCSGATRHEHWINNDSISLHSPQLKLLELFCVCWVRYDYDPFLFEGFLPPEFMLLFIFYFFHYSRRIAKKLTEVDDFDHHVSLYGRIPEISGEDGFWWIVQLWRFLINKLVSATFQTNNTLRKLRSSAFQRSASGGRGQSLHNEILTGRQLLGSWASTFRLGTTNMLE